MLLQFTAAKRGARGKTANDPGLKRTTLTHTANGTEGRAWARPSVLRKDVGQKPTVDNLAHGPSLPWPTSPTGPDDSAGLKTDHPIEVIFSIRTRTGRAVSLLFSPPWSNSQAL